MKKVYTQSLKAICAALILMSVACSKNEEMEAVRSTDEMIAVSDTRVEIREILEVETDTVGSLAAKIGDKSSVVQKLIINGPINAVDVRTIRNLPSLLSIDMKNATICGGDSTYSYKNNSYKLYENEIGNYMFSGTKLSEIILPNELKAINDHAFSGLYGSEPYFTEIIIPESVERIGEYAFYECTRLQHIKLPENLQKIESSTFERCYDLNSIEIGTELKEIEDNAFNSCSDLNAITLPDGLEIMGHRCFYNCGLIEIKIPNSVTTFKGRYNDDPNEDRETFADCSSLKSVTLPQNITEIYSHMFDDCSSLTSITIPETVTVIRDYAFADCTVLSNINFPPHLTEIGQMAFQNNEALTAINLPEETSLTLSHRAFQGSGLTTLKLPASVINIGTYCFFDCNRMITVDMSECQMKTLPENIFYRCSLLTDIKLSESITNISNYCFKECTALESITIPNSVTSLGSSCFYDCSSLKSITLPNSVTTIGSSCFSGCTALENIILPVSLTTIGNYCFEKCEKLTTITIPSNITSIGYDIVYKCYHLTSIFWESKSTIPQSFTSYSIENMNRNLLLYLSNPNTQVLDTNIKNIIINGVAEEIVLNSTQGDFFVPQEFKAIKLNYTRNFSYPTYPGEAAGWRSISLPFTVTDITHSDGRILAPFNANVPGAKPFWLRRLTENGFENVTQIEAGVPYIIAMPNNEAYDDEYNITGSVTFSAQSAQGITVPATSTLTSDMGPNFVLNCNYSYLPTSMTIYALNETATNTQKAGSVFVRNERAVLPFEGYVSSSASSVSISPSYYHIDNNMPTTRSNRPLGSVPTIEDM